MSEPSNFETSHEVTEIDILEPANTIENLIKEPSPHNQESKSEVGNTSMPPNKQEPKLKKKTLPCQKKHPQNLPFLKKVATSYTTHPPMVDSCCIIVKHLYPMLLDFGLHPPNTQFKGSNSNETWDDRNSSGTVLPESQAEKIITVVGANSSVPLRPCMGLSLSSHVWRRKA